MIGVCCGGMASVFAQIEHCGGNNVCEKQPRMNLQNGRTSSVDTDPVEVSRELFRDVRFAPGWKTHHGNDVRTVDIVGSLTCNFSYNNL